ncbi:MAG: GxxExxY protein [Candidatus Levybacteria bacterium]|nr:GxxExxY protein [Candidatus Levybacteria bacterium]
MPILSQNLQNSTQNKTQKHFLFKEESYLIRGACFSLYKKFRNTQKESVYQKSLLLELTNKGLQAVREKQLPIYHLGVKVGVYAPDFVVNGAIIIELKAKPFIHKEDLQQFWYYLKNSEFSLGFLVNFGEPNGVKIIRRVYDNTQNRLNNTRNNTESE